VRQVFLRGLTFEQAAELKGEVQRFVQFTVPPGSVPLLRMIDGLAGFSPATEVLQMSRCGLGLKDAPRLWQKVLKEVLTKAGLLALKADPQLWVSHVDGGLRLAMSSHVDDLKGTGEEDETNRALKLLEEAFGVLKVSVDAFECVGVVHERDARTGEFWIHQHHSVKQLREIDVSRYSFENDEADVPEEIHQLFMSLVGALAWLTLTMATIGVYVSYLQRKNKQPTLGDVRKANRLLRWIRRHLKDLGIRFVKLNGKLKVVVVSDSAFKAQDLRSRNVRFYGASHGRHG